METIKSTKVIDGRFQTIKRNVKDLPYLSLIGIINSNTDKIIASIRELDRRGGIVSESARDKIKELHEVSICHKDMVVKKKQQRKKRKKSIWDRVKYHINEYEYVKYDSILDNFDHTEIITAEKYINGLIKHKYLRMHRGILSRLMPITPQLKTTLIEII